MGILGLTHSEDGQALQRLPVGIKVGIGEPPPANDPKGHPGRLDHFVFKRRKQHGQDVVWEEDKEIANEYGTNPREIGIILMDDDIDNVLKTQLAWWNQTELKCGGKLVQIESNGQERWAMEAIRKTPRAPEGELWPGSYKYTDGPKKGQAVEPCGDTCPDLLEKRCKPNGMLLFNLDRFPMVGAIAFITTTSYRSIRNLSNGLMQIRQITGGRLAGIRVMLRAEPEKITYEGKDGKRHSSIAHILSLRVDATDMKTLLSNMTETAKLFAQTRQLGKQRVEYVIDSSEKERAFDMTQEFYPDNRQLPPAEPHRVDTDAFESVEPQRATNGGKPGPMAPPPADIPTPEDVPLRSEITSLCKQLDINRAGEMSLLGQFKGRLPELVASLKAKKSAERMSDAPKQAPQAPPPQPQAKSAASKSFDF